MKLIFAQYLASLRERDELDAILPDLLSEIGMNVVSRPSRGTKQHGVDVAAVGPHDNSERSLYLFSIKAGNLTRATWDSGPQSLRPSLNEILDAYLGSVSPEYAQLPKVIVLCLGGELHEGVRAEVSGYMASNTRDGVVFELWNGDRIASLLVTGLLGEGALPEVGRTNLRSAIALVEEPDACFRHFCRFVTDICSNCPPSPKARLTAVRQIYIGVWTVYAWARDAGNLEAPYRCSERALLSAWHLGRDVLGEKSAQVGFLRDAVERVIALHSRIADAYEEKCVKPRSNVKHGLSAAVLSGAPRDVNLRVFDLLGRVATNGLWKMHRFLRAEAETTGGAEPPETDELQDSAKLLVEMINNNPVLCTPVKDNQAIDIGIACLFLMKVGCDLAVRQWIREIVGATIFAYTANADYPCRFTDYRDLVAHPKAVPGYREDATSGSILVPTLALLAARLNDAETLRTLADFAAGPYKHSALQLLFPGSDTEENVYSGAVDHGLVACPVRIERTCDAMLANIRDQCTASTDFVSLSAVQEGLLPLLISASRHHRIPFPPQFWFLEDVASGTK